MDLRINISVTYVEVRTIEENKVNGVNILTIVSKYIDIDCGQDFNLTESIIFVKLVIELEDTFNFQFDDHMLSAYKFTTIDSFVEYVVNKIVN